jgi:hypothetical protein
MLFSFEVVGLSYRVHSKGSYGLRRFSVFIIAEATEQFSAFCVTDKFLCDKVKALNSLLSNELLENRT